MTVAAIRKDTQAMTMSVDADFDASPQRIWQLWSDPRQLERWWGPPTYPATFTAHDLTQGGRMAYYMTGPDGDRPHGYWEVLEVKPPQAFVFRDGFADEDGSPNDELPVSLVRVTIKEMGSGCTRMTITTTFPDSESMEQLLAMGMEEGLAQALGQIDAILAEGELAEGDRA